MESIWSETTKITERKALSGDIETEAAVIGGGMAGILTAYFLQQLGMKTVVLEANTIGSGQTQNTTAKITSLHDLKYDKLIQNFDENAARQYANANQKAIAEYVHIIKTNQINCLFEERPAYLYSTEQGEILKREVAAARRLGIDAEFTTDTTLPFQVQGAAKLLGQAQFHPLLFLRAIAAKLTIYENTRVKTVEDGRIMTDNGIVTAKNIVFATHFPFLNFPGYYFMRMYQERSYTLALEHAAELDGMYLGIDKDGLSFRNCGDLLLLGGCSHRTGENSTGGRYQQLRTYAAGFWPKSREVSHWSAQDCMTLDDVPYIGQFSTSTPNWYVATGFGKWGMTGSMISAMFLSDMITGIENQNAKIFSPKRFVLQASAKNLFEGGKQTVKGLTRELFAPPRAEIEQLPNGHGGVVEYDGEKVGVYKNEQGETFIVSIRCPHLGCQLEWNPDELSWDCPCHGSRFDYKGQVLDNPAQENLDCL